MNPIAAELAARQKKCQIELASRDLWEYCKLIAPDFYLDDRTYLKEYCETLQSFYQRELILSNGKIAKKLMIQMPPRHGKTRTLVLFSSWVFGKEPKKKIITAAYNDSLAHSFSKYTRDTITQGRNQDEIVYSDVFPKTRIKFGSSSFKEWALQGAHFSYKGTGTGGGVTGTGGDILIIDDPVKDAETAFNEDALDKLWLWYTSTWISREEPDALQIITNTPWSKRDPGGRLLEGEQSEPDEWYLFSRKAYDEDSGEMLCPSRLSRKKYLDYERLIDPVIFQANYQMNRIDKIGLMYREFTTYAELPDFENTYAHQGRVMVTDTAGKGKDYLCSIYFYATGEHAYVFDVDYTKEDIDITEKTAADKIVKYKINTADIESNSAGHSWAFHVEKRCKDDWKWHGTTFLEKAQTKNKDARIFTHNREVNRRIIFPHDWRQRWPVFYNAVMTYSRTGKNKNDDAPDTMTRVIEYLNSGGAGIVLPK